MSESRNQRKSRVGTVVSDKMDKTIVVRLQSAKRHPFYRKIIRRASRIKVHDEKNTARVGDVVKVMETRPISAEKRWRLVEIIERAK